MLGLVLLTTGTAAARNFVKNPGFEEPLAPDNWSVVYDNCDAGDFLVAGRTTMANKDVVPGTWDAEPPGSTNYVSRLGGHFAPNYCNGLMHGYFRQVVTNLTPGRQYLCSAWMVQYTRNDNYIERSQVWMEALGGPSRTVSQVTQYVTNNANNNPAGWKRYAVTNTASAKGELELRLHYAFVRTIAQIWEYRNVNAYYDEVEVQVLNNQPPVADASATVSPVTATNRVDAQVVLDGSRSSDPDNDPLRYSWYRAGVPNAIATGMVAVVTLPVGTNLLELAVDDGMATNRQAFAVEVVKLNHPPVADPSATVGLVISPNWVNAQVVLDGSRSSDADGDPLTYDVYAGATSPPTAKVCSTTAEGCTPSPALPDNASMSMTGKYVVVTYSDLDYAEVFTPDLRSSRPGPDATSAHNSPISTAGSSQCGPNDSHRGKAICRPLAATTASGAPLRLEQGRLTDSVDTLGEDDRHPSVAAALIHPSHCLRQRPQGAGFRAGIRVRTGRRIDPDFARAGLLRGELSEAKNAGRRSRFESCFHYLSSFHVCLFGRRREAQCES